MLPGGAGGACRFEERERGRDRGRERGRERDTARRECRSMRERETQPTVAGNATHVAGNAATTTAWSPLPTSSFPCPDLQDLIISSPFDAGKWSNALRRIQIWYMWFAELRPSFRRTTTIFGTGELRSSVPHRSDNQPPPDQPPLAARAACSDGSIYSPEYRRLFVGNQRRVPEVQATSPNK
jgi:hypothetical protein